VTSLIGNCIKHLKLSHSMWAVKYCTQPIRYSPVTLNFDLLTSEFKAFIAKCVHLSHCASIHQATMWNCFLHRDVTEPANIRIHRMRISCSKSVGFGDADADLLCDQNYQLF